MSPNLIATLIVASGLTYDDAADRAPRLRDNLGQLEAGISEGDASTQSGRVSLQYRGIDLGVRLQNLNCTSLGANRDYEGIRESDYDIHEVGGEIGAGYTRTVTEFLGATLDIGGRLSYQYIALNKDGYTGYPYSWRDSQTGAKESRLYPRRVNDAESWTVTTFALGAQLKSNSTLKNVGLDFRQYWENQDYPGLLTADPNNSQSSADRTRFDLSFDTAFGLHGGLGTYTHDSEIRPLGELGYRFGFGFDFIIKALAVEFDPAVAYLDYSVNPNNSQIEFRLGFSFSADHNDLIKIKSRFVDQDTLGLDVTIPMSGKFGQGIQFHAGFHRTSHTYIDGNNAESASDLEQYQNIPRYQNRVVQEISLGLSLAF